jgi:hypothetical protein
MVLGEQKAEKLVDLRGLGPFYLPFPRCVFPTYYM